MPCRMQEKNKYRVMGIDPGTNSTGFAVIDYHFDDGTVNIVTAFTINRKDILHERPWIAEVYGKREAAIQGYACTLGALLNTWEPEGVICEAPYLGRFPQSFMALTEIVASFRNVVMEWDITIPLKAVKPSAVKTRVGVKGNSGDKEEMRKALTALNFNTCIPISALDEHAVDACCIAYYEIMAVVERIPPWE